MWLYGCVTCEPYLFCWCDYVHTRFIIFCVAQRSGGGAARLGVRIRYVFVRININVA